MVTLNKVRLIINGTIIFGKKIFQTNLYFIANIHELNYVESERKNCALWILIYIVYNNTIKIRWLNIVLRSYTQESCCGIRNQCRIID